MRIIGHEKIVSFLNKSVAEGKISQAYLFSGPEHVGKYTLAMELAQKLTGGSNQKINPDIMIISPQTEEKRGIIRTKDIKIEQIRGLKHWLGLSSHQGEYKAAIIDNAEKLTISAQNAMLKILEEPQEKCVLILVCHNQEKILLTIKSRCVMKSFGLVKRSQIAKIMSDEKNDSEIIFWSLGRPGIAMSLKEKEGELSSRKEAKKELERMFRSNLNDKFIFAEALSKNSADLINKLNLWTVIFRENIFQRDNFSFISSEKAINLIGKITESLSLIKETNSNIRLVLENLFLNFEQ